jgi:antitoxin HigA-1
MINDKLSPIHPGEILQTEFLQVFKISQYRLAKDINVPTIRISEIVKGQRSITANIALRLEKYFGVSAQFWTNLQSKYDLEIQKESLLETLELKVKIFNTEIKPTSKLLLAK